MTKQTRRRRGRLAALAAVVALTVSGQPGALGRVAPPPMSDCEGDGCTAVAVTFDEAKGQYRVRNNSADAWVRVTASNMSASAEVCVAPGKSDYLSLKSIVGAYKADRGSSCGGAGGGT
jgi:hypothetical protein